MIEVVDEESSSLTTGDGLERALVSDHEDGEHANVSLPHCPRCQR